MATIITTFHDIYLMTSDGKYEIGSEIDSEGGYIQTAIYPIDPHDYLTYIDITDDNAIPGEYVRVARAHRAALKSIEWIENNPMNPRDLTE